MKVSIKRRKSYLSSNVLLYIDSKLKVWKKLRIVTRFVKHVTILQCREHILHGVKS